MLLSLPSLKHENKTNIQCIKHDVNSVKRHDVLTKCTKSLQIINGNINKTVAKDHTGVRAVEKSKILLVLRWS